MRDRSTSAGDERHAWISRSLSGQNRCCSGVSGTTTLSATPDALIRPPVMRAVVGMDEGRLRVVVADDRAEIRTHLRKLLDAQPDLDVVGTGWSGMEALRLVHQLEPDVLVLDHDMEVVPGIDVAAHLGVAGMTIRVVLYAIDDGLGAADPSQCVLDEASVDALMRAIKRPRATELAARMN